MSSEEAQQVKSEVKQEHSTKTVVLVASDGETKFTVPSHIAKMSKAVANMLEDLGDEDGMEIPLASVSAVMLNKILEYCTHYDGVLPPIKEDKFADLEPWDKEFCNLDQAVLFELILAANFLDIKPLLEIGCKTIADMIKGKTPEEIRKHFNIVNDFTPEEEAEIIKENNWINEN